MRKMFDFTCQICGTIKEALVRPGEAPECHGPMVVRLTAPRFKLEGITGDFPTASDKWARDHTEAARVAAKRNEGKYED